MPITRELAVKFVESGLKKLQADVDAATKKVAASLEGLIQKAKETAATLDSIRAQKLLPDVSSEKLEANLVRAFGQIRRKVDAELKGLGITSQAVFGRIALDAAAIGKSIEKAGVIGGIDRIRLEAALLEKQLLADTQAARTLGIALSKSFEAGSLRANAALQTIRVSPTASRADILTATAAAGTADLARSAAAAQTLGVTLEATFDNLREKAIAAFAALKEGGRATKLDVVRAEAELLARDLERDAVAAKQLGIALENSFSAAAVRGRAAFETIKASLGATRIDKLLAAVALLKLELAGTAASAQKLGFTLARSFGLSADEARIAAGRVQASTAATPADRLQAQVGVDTAELARASQAAQKLGFTLQQSFALARKEALAFAAVLAETGRAGPIDKLRIEAALLERALLADAAAAQELGIRLSKAADVDLAKAQAGLAQLRVSPTATRGDVLGGEAAVFRRSIADTEQAAQHLGVSLGASFKAAKLEAEAAFEKIRASGTASFADIIKARNVVFERTAQADAATKQVTTLGEAFGLVNKRAEGGRGAFRRYAGYLASLTFEITGAIFGLTAFGAALIAPFAAIGKIGGKFEQINATLRSLGDTAEEAAEGTKFLKEFFLSDVQQFDLDPLLRAFTKLKASGIDPTKGALLTLTDAITATGGGAEQLDAAARAFSQIASKTKVTSEELIGQAAEALPSVIQAAARGNKVAVAELLANMKKSSVGAKEFLQNLFDELSKQFEGAGKRQAGTFQGLINQLTKEWNRFVLAVGDAGLFDKIKESLDKFVKGLNAARADGSFQEFIENTAKSLEVFGKGLLATIGFVQEWGGTILNVVAAVAGAAVFKTLAKAVIGIVDAFKLILPAVLSFRAAAVTAGGAFALLSRLGLAAIGPTGWLVALVLVFWDLAAAIFGAEKKVDRLAARMKALEGTEFNIGGVFDLNIDQSLKNIQVLEARLRLVKTALAEPFPTAGRGGVSPERDALIRQRQEIERELAGEQKLIALAREKLAADAKRKGSAFEKVETSVGDGGAAGESAAERLRKARLAALLRGFEDEIKLNKEKLDKETRDLEESYAQNLISTSAYFKKRAELAVKALTDESGLIDKKIAAERAALVDAKDEAERVNITTNINSLLNEQKIVLLKIAEVNSNITKDTIKAEDAFAKQLAAINDEFEELQGRPGQGTRLKLLEQYGPVLAQLNARLDEAIRKGNENEVIVLKRQVKIVTEVIDVKGPLENLQKRLSDIREKESQDEARISAESATQLFPEFNERLRLTEANTKSAEKLRAVLRDLVDLSAKHPGTAAIQNLIQEVSTQITVLDASSNQLLLDLKNTAQESLVGVFDDLTDGIGKAGDAMDKFALDFLGAVRRIIINNFVQQLFGGLFNKDQSISQPTGTGSGIVNLGASLLGIKTPEAAGKKKGLEDVTAASPLPVAIITDATGRGLLPGAGPAGAASVLGKLTSGVLPQTGPLTIDQILAGAGAPGGAPVEEPGQLAKAAAGGGFFDSIFGGIKDLFSGLFDTLGGALKGLFSGGGEIFKSVIGIFSGLFHTGGVVGDGAPRETRLVPFHAFANAARMHSGGLVGARSNERPILAEVGEEILTRNDPRHRDNARGAPTSISVNVHPRALHLTMQAWLEGEFSRISAMR